MGTSILDRDKVENDPVGPHFLQRHMAGEMTAGPRFALGSADVDVPARAHATSPAAAGIRRNASVGKRRTCGGQECIAQQRHASRCVCGDLEDTGARERYHRGAERAHQRLAAEGSGVRVKVGVSTAASLSPQPALAHDRPARFCLVVAWPEHRQRTTAFF
ncbi:MAG: hypothetical protein IPK80_25200 [Nannocystis sp.]|nr:hypothetical protein [Nannocystis sp.]